MNRAGVRSLIAVVAAAAAVTTAGPASADVAGAVSEYWGTCPALAAGTSAANPSTLSPGPAAYEWPRQTSTDTAWTGAGPSLSNVDADSTTLTLASYERAAHDSGDTTWCQLHAHLANVLTVGAGTSGLAVGDPVTVVLNTAFGGSLGGWGDPGTSFGTSAGASVTFSVKDGYTTLARYTADGYANIDGVAGNATESAAGKYDLYLYGNDSGSSSETPNEQQSTLAGGVPGSYAAPPVVDFGSTVGSRSIRFDTHVGATLNLDGALRTDEQSFGGYSAGVVDLEPGFHAAFAADPANPGITLTLATDTTTAPTTAAVTSGHVVFGQAAPLVATITSSSGTPSGAVAFSVDGAPVGSAQLDTDGVATLPFNTTSPYLHAGVHTVTAVYAGDSAHDGSSGSGPLTVTRASTTTALTVSPGPVTPNQQVTLTAAVATVAPGAGVPAGVVVVTDGGTLLGTARVNATGIATLVVPGRQLLGHHVLTATYGGDADHGGSVGTRTIPVNK